jgi:hypothetical protein
MMDRVATTGLPEGLPQGLRAELTSRDAVIGRWWRLGRRLYLHADGPQGPLFARASSDPRDAERMDHEVAVRAIVGTEGPLRAPPVLARGRSWMLDVGIRRRPWAGTEDVDAVLAAAERVSALDLPVVPPGGGWSALRASLARRVRLIRSPLPLADVVRARRMGPARSLPRVTSHGDFYAENVLIDERAAWVVDWELTGRRPAGTDPLRFWTTLERPEDRDRLWEGTVALVGARHHRALAELRYVLLVRTIADMLTDVHPECREPEAAAALLALLPVVRAEAGV